MTSAHIRATLAIAAAAGLLLALTSCAPAAHAPHHGSHPSAGSTTTPTPTPTPTVPPLVQPASRYSFSCSDVISASSVASIYTVPMSPIDSAKFAQLDINSELPYEYWIRQLGGLDCTWSDGTVPGVTTHWMTLDILPVTLAEWNIYAKGGAVSLTNNASISCSTGSNNNGCEYETYVNGSRFDLATYNMVPTPAGQTLPAQMKAMVASIAAKLTSTTVGAAPAAQQASVTLPAAGTSMLTGPQTASALGTSAAITAKMKIDCSGDTDGPWEIFNEAQKEVDGNLGCSFGPPYDGGSDGPYGLFEWIPAGQWAATQLESFTPSAVQVTVPAMPAGDSLYEYKDSNGDLVGQLVIGGNLVTFMLFAPATTGEPLGSVPLATAVVNLAADFETTIRS
jgi:hypothetical protein